MLLCPALQALQNSMAQIRLTLVSRRTAYLGSALHLAGGLTSSDCEQMDAEVQQYLQTCQQKLQTFREWCIKELHRGIADQLVSELSALASMCQRLQAVRVQLHLRRERLNKHASLSGTCLRRRTRKRSGMVRDPVRTPAAEGLLPSPPPVMVEDIQRTTEEEPSALSAQATVARQQEQQSILVFAHTLEDDIQKAEARVSKS